jgi:hypothetical protein
MKKIVLRISIIMICITSISAYGTKKPKKYPRVFSQNAIRCHALRNTNRNPRDNCERVVPQNLIFQFPENDLPDQWSKETIRKYIEEHKQKILYSFYVGCLIPSAAERFQSIGQNLNPVLSCNETVGNIITRLLHA